MDKFLWDGSGHASRTEWPIPAGRGARLAGRRRRPTVPGAAGVPRGPRPRALLGRTERATGRCRRLAWPLTPL